MRERGTVGARAHSEANVISVEVIARKIQHAKMQEAQYAKTSSQRVLQEPLIRVFADVEIQSQCP